MKRKCDDCNIYFANIITNDKSICNHCNSKILIDKLIIKINSNNITSVA